MTLPPHDHPALEAVDELATVRAHIERLRNREAELCDEIRSFATQTGGMRVCGTSRDAVIEQRRPRRVDLGKLPKEVFLDPSLLIEQAETVVLIWPKTTAAAVPSALPAPVSHLDPALTDTPEARPSDGPVDVPPEQRADSMDFPEITDDLPQEQVFKTEEMDVGFGGLEETSDDRLIDDRLIEVSIASEPATTARGSVTPSPTEMRTIGAPVNEGDPIGDMLDLSDRFEAVDSPEDINVAAPDLPPFARDAPAPRPEEKITVTSEDPFGLKDAPQTPSSPTYLDVTADGAPECETPRDLRPTTHAHLQPMAGLHEEEIAQALADADAPLDPVTLSEALSEAQRLETEMDLQVELGKFDLSDDLPAAFATSRAISGG
ncbi:hypothetical protein [Celeribacter baekdonensis]|uniref:hypothetical protein n=1 Tax=Celeribacter baekdonensis TaxID=875171 RepID=UPI0002D6D415|nr:hypothetical protein [Celeribacter baekdonensis]